MPSFDIVSEVDKHEVANAIDQSNIEVSARFDFKGSDARIECNEFTLKILADDEFKIGQVTDILESKLAKRSIDIGCLDHGEVKERGAGKAQQEITIRHGIDKILAKKLIKIIKSSKLKIQSSIQGEQLRVSGKKRDDLQEIMTILKNDEFDLPLQYVNFRD